MKEIIIGRKGDQPFKITAAGVSAHHASLTLHDDGRWVLKDLDSTNGTYIRNEDYAFERIATKVIGPDTVIRLGADESIRCFQFTAIQLVKADPNDFRHEFATLREKWNRVVEQRARIEKQTGRLSFLPPFISATMLLLTLPIKDINIIRAAMMVPGILSPFIGSFGRKKLKELNEQIKRTFVCPNPKCGLPLSETELKKGQCFKCKSHI